MITTEQQIAALLEFTRKNSSDPAIEQFAAALLATQSREVIFELYKTYCTDAMESKQ